VGREFGAALRTIRSALGGPEWAKIVLAGSVGRLWGLPARPAEPDILLRAMAEGYGQPVPALCRSQMGLDAEFLGLGTEALRSNRWSHS
jgi:hypothetical protein